MIAKILYVDHAPVYGGAEATLVRVAAALDRGTYAPLVVLNPCPLMEDALTARSIPFRILPLQALNRRDWRTVPAAFESARRLSAMARKEQASLLHTNTLRTHVLGVPAAAAARLPLVWTLHDLTWPPLLFRVLSHKPAAIICVSRTIYETYVRFCSHSEKMHIIYNGLELSAVMPERVAMLRHSLGLPPDKPIVSVIGRLVRGKGQDLFLQSAATVAARHPDAIFVIAGNASDETTRAEQLIDMSTLNEGGKLYEQELRTLAATLGLTDRVFFTGFMSNPEALYQTSSIVVHPGTMPEGLPTVLIEAMSAGRPVVASNVRAAYEIVDDGVTGLIVPRSDADALANAITILLDDPRRADAMGTAGRERAEKLFNIERQIAAYEAIYQTILDG